MKARTSLIKIRKRKRFNKRTEYMKVKRKQSHHGGILIGNIIFSVCFNKLAISREAT